MFVDLADELLDTELLNTERSRLVHMELVVEGRCTSRTVAVENNYKRISIKNCHWAHHPNFIVWAAQELWCEHNDDDVVDPGEEVNTSEDKFQDPPYFAYR